MKLTLNLDQKLVRDILNLDGKKQSFDAAVNSLLAFSLAELQRDKGKRFSPESNIDLLDKPKSYIFATVMIDKILESDSEAFKNESGYAVQEFYHLIDGAPAYDSLTMGDKQRLARSFLTKIKERKFTENNSPRIDVLKTTPKRFRIVRG